MGETKKNLTSEGDKSYFDISLDIVSGFSYLEYHTDALIKATKPNLITTPYSFIRKVQIDNHTDEQYDDLILSFSFDNPLFESFEVHTGFVDKLKKFTLRKALPLKIDAEALYKQNGIGVCAIYFKAMNPISGEEIFSSSRTVKIYPVDICSDKKERIPFLLAKYCVTGFPELSQIHQMAITENGGNALIGYQNPDPNAVLKEVKALYNAIHKYGINYSNPPHSTAFFQNIRLPNRVLKEKLGTCIDLSILFCSALLDIGLHPLLIVTKEHSFCGVFLEPEIEMNLVYDNANEILSLSQSGLNQLVLFECTTIQAESNASFASAMKIGVNNLTGYRGEFYATDVYLCHKSFYAPIPLFNEQGKLESNINPVDIKEDESLELEEFQFAPIENHPKDRFAVWEKKLLDLTSANRLVNFRFSKNATNYAVCLCDYGSDVFNLLKKDQDESITVSLYPGACSIDFNMEGIPESAEALESQAYRLAIKNGSLLLGSSLKVMKALVATDLANREETGSPTLYLAFGVITCTMGKKTFNAPFLLLPVSFTKNRFAESKYTMKYDFDDLMVNQTFFEYLRVKTGEDYSYLYGVSAQDDYRNIVANFRKRADSSISLNENTVFLANFTFAHYVMWEDIKNRQKELRKNPVVSSLLDNHSEIENKDIVEGKNADEMDDYQDFVAPLPYDSTQLRAIVACAKGNSFILEGPPGTGKSQTIVNMIVNAVCHGKSVLFVAEKQAALEVVRKRLAALKFNGDIGLDAFALQLYSDKTEKKSFFRQLGQAMNQVNLLSKEDYQATCKELKETRDEVNKELKKLHSHNGLFLSLFEAYNLLIETQNQRGKYSLSEDFISNYDSQNNERIKDLFASIKNTAANIASYPDTPLRYFGFKVFGIKEKYAIQSDVDSLRNNYSTLINARNNLLRPFNINRPDSPEEIEKDFDVLSSLFDKDTNVHFINSANFFAQENETKAFLSDAERIRQDLKDLKGKVAESKLDSFPLNEERAALQKAQTFFRKLFFKRKPYKMAKAYLADDYFPDNDEIQKLCNTIENYRILVKKHSDDYAVYSRFFIKPYAIETTTEELERTYRKTKEACQKLILRPDLDPLVSALAVQDSLAYQRIANSFGIFENAYLKFKSEYDIFQSKYSLDSSLEQSTGFARVLSDLSYALKDPVRLEELHSIANLNRDKEELNALNIHGLIEGVEQKAIDVKDLDDAFDQALALAFVKHYEKDQYVVNFNDFNYDNKIKEFQELLEKYRRCCIAEAVSKITAPFYDNSFEYSSTNPIGQLKKLVNNSGRGVTIRWTIEHYEDYVRTYFPCFLMSPLAAAQYLSVDSKKFDVVIFDEASQIPTCEAVGPIARGNSLIVAGDPKQMPPSSYFTANINAPADQSEENVELLDAESLLDDCISIEMPRLSLAFHYRSRHESLIAFSNHNFYHDSLFTFPSPDNSSPHILFQYVDSGIDKNGNKFTKTEIDSIVSWVVRLLSNTQTENKSLGIIVFNIDQQAVLMEKLDNLFAQNPDLAAKAHWDEPDSDKKLFVKNLESVQGDERDIIILAIAFGRNKNGEALLNGPLMLDRGERRLNVAVSRSKEAMIILSTIRAKDISLANHKNNGAKVLKDLLTYAETQSNGQESTGSTIQKANALVLSLKKQLEEKGFIVDLAVGRSEFKIDLALKKPGNSNYILGILLDETPLNPNLSAADRFYVEPVFLQGLKWKLVRIYSFTYMREPNRTIQKIVEAVDKTVEEPEEPLLLNMEKATPVYENWFSSYSAYVPPKRLDYDSLNSFSTRLFKEMITEAIQEESPISYSRLKQLTKDIFGLNRIGSRVESLLTRVLSQTGFTKTEDYDGESFYWSDSSHTVSAYRQDSNLDSYQVSKEEIAFLMSKIAKRAKTISRSDLIQETADYMGLNKVTERARLKLNYCVDYALSAGLLDEGFVESYKNEPMSL